MNKESGYQEERGGGGGGEEAAAGGAGGGGTFADTIQYNTIQYILLVHP